MDRSIEIVAPAGDYDSFISAVKAGADAIYLGIKGFGARKSAVNFTLKELEEIVDYAHIVGVKIYVTLNTIMKDTEIKNLHENIVRMYEMGVDAFIVQDYGLFYYLKLNFKDIAIHASTQMTITTNEDAHTIYKEGFKRVVLGRELSFEEIKKIKENSQIELEVFVSGALCVSYSGKCYFSSLIGGRSGNRGMCAQPCRKKYTDLNNSSGYHLSLKDQFMSIEEIKKLKEINIDSIKIEGRMKNSLYVYEAVKYYREVIDSIEGKQTANGDNFNENIKKLFNRGYEKGYFYNKNSDKINNKYPSHYGEELGDYDSRRKDIILKTQLSLGDGVIFLDENYNIISGTYVNKIDKLGRNRVKIEDVPNNTKYIFKNFDNDLNRDLKKEIKQKKRKNMINGEITIKVGKPLELIFTKGDILAKITKENVELAKKNILQENDIIEKVSELGETEFELENLKINYDNKGFAPFGLLKEIKRECALLLRENILKNYKREYKNQNKIDSYENKRTKTNPKLAAMVSNENQYKICEEMGIEKIYYREKIVNKYNSNKNRSEYLLVNRISELINAKKKVSIDWTFNIINTYSLKYLSKFHENIDTVYLSPEISFNEIENLNSNDLNLGIVIYGKMLLMYTELPLFESDTKITNEQEDKFLVNINSNRNTEIYLDKPLNIISKINYLGSQGIKEIRLDFIDETEDEIKYIIDSINKNRYIGYEPYNYEKGVF
ncbi:MAG: U32 family peptidase [Fusobacteria bacterium]|nr:U32 family peptidase [Fusobacteriota bacterium]